MLVLSRRVGEEIIIGNDVRVRVVAVKGDRVRIGISAPDHVSVDRAEVHARRSEFVEITVPAASDDDSAVCLGAHPGPSDGDTAKH